MFRSSYTYTNQVTTCQTYFDNTYWHIKIYDLTGSQLDTNWLIHIFAKFTSATLTYTFSIMPQNL